MSWRAAIGRRPWASAALVAMACAAAPARTSGPTLRAPHHQAELLYVCNQDDASVSVIDLASHTVVRTIDLEALGFSATARPHDVAVEPDGSYWYLSLIGEHRVLKFDRHDRLVASASFETPGMLGRHPDGARLFVARSMTAPSPPQRIGVIRRADMTLDEIEIFFPRPHALAIDRQGRYVYTASLSENQVIAVEAEHYETTFVPVEGPSHVLAHFGLSPDGRRLVVSAERSARMLVFDASAPPALTPVASVPVNAQPWHPVFTPDGRFVYVGNQGANTVTVLETETWTVVDVIAGEALAEPHGSAVSPDGRYVYISNRNLRGTYRPRGTDVPVGTVVVIDTETRDIVRVIEVERGPTGLGMRFAHH